MVSVVVVGDQVLLADHDPPADESQQSEIVRSEDLLWPVHYVGQRSAASRFVIAQQLDPRRGRQRIARALGNVGRDQHPHPQPRLARQSQDQLDHIGLRPADLRGQRPSVDRHRQPTQGHTRAVYRAT